MASSRGRVTLAAVSGAAAVALLVVGIIPFTSFTEWPTPDAAPVSLGVVRCRVVAAWNTPPPPSGRLWAGQTNWLGVRFDRTSGGTTHLWVPIWMASPPLLAAALLAAPRGRRRRSFPLVRIALLALPPLVVVLLWARSHTSGAGFHIVGARCLDFSPGRVLVQRIETTTFSGRYTSSATVTQAELPIWAIVVASSVPLVVFAWRHRRRIVGYAGHECAVCGYDLRATPDRCPECGTPAAAAGSGATNVHA